MPNAVYNNYKNLAMTGQVSLTNDTINVALVTDSYTPDIDNETTYADIQATGFEVPAGGGYTTGGIPMTDKSIITNNSTDVAIFSAANTTFESSTFSSKGAVIYKDGGTPSNSPLLFFVDFGFNRSVSNQDFTIAWNTSGVMQFS